ncbi:MAG TPA: PH domain-containing protein [Ilumatobacteraceae bacterium]|nr:PH domain-containing protein [Ilumatobacteraceae bacterium]
MAPTSFGMIDLTQPQRQSPIAIVLLGVRAIRSLGIAQIALGVFFLARGAADGRLVFVVAVAVALLAAVSVLSWWRYTFQLADGELVVTRGVLRIDRLTVATDRIQSIAIEQELLHRLTDVVKVVVTTAGTAQAEFTIDAVALPVAEELRRRASAPGAAVAASHDASGGPGRPTERVVFQHTPRRLAVAALTMSPWAGLALIPPLLFGLQQTLEPVADDLSEAVPDVDVDGLGWWLVPVIVIAAPLFVVLLNLGRVYLADWQQALHTDSTTLRRTSGLLSRFSTTSSVARVQVMTSRQNWLQRRAGIRDVHLSNAGDGDMRLIACRDEEFAATAESAGLTPSDRLALDRRVHPVEIWLRARNTAIVAVAVGAAGVLLIGWWATLVLVVVPWAWWSSRRHVRNHRWSFGTELATSSRVISSSTEQALVRKANVVRVTQTIFERRRGLGQVEVATAAGAIRVGMIPVDEAQAVRDVILYGVETDRRPWM